MGQDVAFHPKLWEEMSELEVLRLKRQQCSKCYYLSTKKGEVRSDSTCEYIRIVGHSRGCSPFECVEMGVFKQRKGSRRKKGKDKKLAEGIGEDYIMFRE